MVGIPVSVYIPLDLYERMEEVLSYPGTPFKSKSDLIRHNLEQTLNEYDQEDYKISEYEFGKKARQEDKSRKPYNVDIPFYERSFNDNPKVPPTYDDGIPNPEHFRDMEDMLDYVGSDIGNVREKLQAKYGMTWGDMYMRMTGTTYVDPQYASTEHVQEEREALDRGPIGPPA